VEDLIVKLDRVVLQKHTQDDSGLNEFELDASVLSVLTEYEEHRLRENVRMGRALYRVHAAFDLMTIDKGLEDLKKRLKTVGEVSPYLPSAESGNDQQTELDLILGSGATLEEVQTVLEGSAATVTAVPRTAHVDRPPSAPPPARTEAPAPTTDEPA